MRKSILLAIILMTIAIGVVWWGIKKGGWFQEKDLQKAKQEDAVLKEFPLNKEQAKEKGFIKRGLSIKVYKISRTTFEDLLPSMGSIKGLTTRKLNFEVPGIVEEINFREGDLVKSGQLIGRLKQKEALLKIDFNRAKLKSAMVSLVQAEKKVKLYRALFEVGAINQLKLSEVEAEGGNAKHQVEAAQVEIESAQEELKKTEMHAPADCILGERNIEVGELVSPYTPKAVEIVEIDTVYAEVGIVERDVTKIKIGQLARVYVDSYPDLPFDGIIDNIYPILSEKTRTLPVEIKIDNSRRMLMPGMFARADIILFEKPGVISIPRIALKKLEDAALVYVVEEATNTSQERIVETGYESTDYVEITRGLKEGDLVAISNIEQLTSGTPVQITEIQVREM
ncbi:MAG: efflux RND transporter periplasmic adaptor subunit [Candidatus Omnitrophica bacterium]|nr:efflux RND transporter periplasmic adaptor subunit [Candidatus Omnitrophota bacterium]MBU4478544.1 efflux RND transporter periplasmic adaptor subunit [Candidatus Omnitrophota bacterium]MCG2702859.1 efflux RND transporter periplasmic adaptor subunit [Candidatus Omnitrophota bacterium]